MLLCLCISFDHTLGLPLPFCLHCDSILRSTVIVVAIADVVVVVVVVLVVVDVDLHSQLPSRAFMLIMRSLQLVGWLVGNPKIAPFVKLAKKSSPFGLAAKKSASATKNGVKNLFGCVVQCISALSRPGFDSF